MTQIMLIGSSGQLGWQLRHVLSTLGNLVLCDRAMIDLTKPHTIRHAIQTIKPDIIVNAAAYTNVERAESESEQAIAINAHAPMVMAEEAKRTQALLIHYSTDYVFDGTQKTPYTEADTPNPINCYGHSKWLGEQAIQAVDVPHYIFRVSWLYSMQRHNFLKTVLHFIQNNKDMRIVDDQYGTPTWTRTVAEKSKAILMQADKKQYGIYHLCPQGNTTWYQFAYSILCHNPSTTTSTFTAIHSAEYPTAAKRPRNSSLSTTKATHYFGLEFPTWQHDLQRCLQDETVASKYMDSV